MRSGSVDDTASVDGWSPAMPAPVADAALGGPESTTDGPGGPIGGPSGGQGPGDTDPWALAGLIGGHGVTAEQRMLVAAISTTTTTAAVMAFLFFGKRRRDGEPPAPDEVLAADAARLTAEPAAAAVASVANRDAGLGPDESAMPRWRRPSLIAVRKADPLRNGSTDVKLSFAGGSVEPIGDHERRRIRYRVVRLLDAPDELRSQEIGLLDDGDEVELLERSGAFWLVLCPDGNQGWVHKMTLGDVVDTPSLEASDRSFAEATEMIDGDVLAAFLAARERSEADAGS